MVILGVLMILVGFISLLVSIVLFIIGAIKKNSKAKRNSIILGASFALIIVGFITLPKTSDNKESTSYHEKQKAVNQNNNSEETQSSEIEKKKQADLDSENALKKQVEEQIAAQSDPSTYRSDVNYDNLARTPDDFLSEKIVLSGKVIQVMEDDSTTQLRLATNEDYDAVVLVEYNSSIVQERVLENDLITIYGTSNGLISYESTLGGTITIPSITAYIINR